MQPYLIATSILSADFSRLGEEANKAIAAGADMIHFDVMDNHYVPNLSMGPMVCKALLDHGINVPIDVHLMTEPVDNLIPKFAHAGATYITFHPEASLHVDRSIQTIRDHGCKAGLVLNLTTPLSILDYVLPKLDMILIMSINAGFAGQQFEPMALKKLQDTRKLIDSHAPHIRLQIDGGVKISNIYSIAAAGADTFVIGSALFKTHDYQHTMEQFRAELAREHF